MPSIQNPEKNYRAFLLERAVLQDERKRRIKTIIFVLLFLWLSSYVLGKILAEDTGEKLAVIPIEGVILGDESGSFFGDKVAASSTIVPLLERAAEKENIKAVLLEINSPGGTVVASKEIATAVKAIDKPVIAWIREVGASGAYWIASTSDYIIADELSITGSIGVNGGYLEFSGLMDDYGVGYEQLIAGDYKDLGNRYEKLNVERRAILQEKLDTIHEYFITDVAANRGLPTEDIRAVSEGLYYLGVEAKEIGLIDGFGNRDTAKEKAEELAGIEDLKEVSYRQRERFFDVFDSFGVHTFYSIGRGIGDSLFRSNSGNFFTPRV